MQGWRRESRGRRSEAEYWKMKLRFLTMEAHIGEGT
jgi:hypothetical protein